MINTTIRWTKEQLTRSHSNYQNLFEWLCVTYDIELYYDHTWGTYPFAYSINGQQRMYRYSTEVDALLSALREIIEPDHK